jgi:hypothetical protein
MYYLEIIFEREKERQITKRCRRKRERILRDTVDGRE